MNQLGLVTPEYCPALWCRLQALQKTEVAVNQESDHRSCDDKNGFFELEQKLHAVNNIKTLNNDTQTNSTENRVAASSANERSYFAKEEESIASEVQMDTRSNADTPDKPLEEILFCNKLDLKRPLDECNTISDKELKKVKC